MAFKKLYFEIFEEFENTSSRQEKIEILRNNSDDMFVQFLNYAFNPDIKFDVEKIPAYKPAPEPAGLTWSTLHLELKKLYLFMPGNPRYNGKLPARKHENMLVELLQRVHAKEAKLLEAVLMHNIKVKGLTPKLVKEAFPTLPFEVK
jgi:hypothetical protein